MGYPQQPHDPYGQSGPQQGHPAHQQQPYPQGQPMPYQQPYPPQAYAGQPPMRVQQVGKSVTKPAWTIGEICWVVFTCGMAWPIVWMKRRSKTTITRHKQ